eukprot:m.965553 g.965553  ORF g.965553 m.965553 type:complete len:246 (-) comp23909_c0_seq23:2314-3051(-)
MSKIKDTAASNTSISEEFNQLLFIAIDLDCFADITLILRRDSHEGLAWEDDNYQRSPHLRLLQKIARHTSASNDMTEALQALYMRRWVLTKPIARLFAGNQNARDALRSVCRGLSDTYRFQKTKSTPLHCVLQDCLHDTIDQKVALELTAAALDRYEEPRRRNVLASHADLVGKCTNAPQLQETLLPKLFGKNARGWMRITLVQSAYCPCFLVECWYHRGQNVTKSLKIAVCATLSQLTRYYQEY